MIRLLARKRVLVLGEDTRSFLSVIRSLGEAGMVVDVVTLINTTPTLSSKWINKIFKLNYQAYSQNDWQTTLSRIIDSGNYDLVIPCDERSLYPLLDIKETTLSDTIFAIPERDILGPLFDKEQTKQLAQQLGISVARGERIDLNDTSPKKLIDEFGLPVVLKPSMSYESEQLNHRNSVMIAWSAEDIETFKQSNSQCLIEEYFDGTGMGVSVFSSKGKIRAAFAHRRVSEPEKGGGSSYRKAWPLSPDMLDACQKICVNLNYTGVGMFEFKYNDATHRWILIEINARFWGSLPLAIFAGVDFPKLLAIHLLTDQRPYKLTYNLKAHARSLTSDFYDMKASFDAKRQTMGNIKALFNTLPRLTSFLRLLTGNDTIDSFHWKDKAPFYVELKQLFGDKLHQLVTFNKVGGLTSVGCKTLSCAPLDEILVICYGNIMRSPFAVALIKRALEKHNINIEVKGAGFHQNSGRSSPERCIVQAQRWGIDLSYHRSVWLSQAMIKSRGQLIVYFDLKHRYLLESYYENYNAINLAHFVPKPKGPLREIADPYDESEEALRVCYENIDNAVDALIAQIIKCGLIRTNKHDSTRDSLVSTH
ncbi:ATP-grasp domain-containing protein [Alteromonas sp. Cnat3-28]|uniref:arsenate reductase/protein-tyrosine-phosphatase family protein n=1 Tax=Alteromonas sp. Cnat3-28 TaxID=2917729 RepID=UPI001EF4C5FE|nr:ATP-grasp domain-containing protein [Alteromonas sp. Cnat3-28]